MQLERRSSWAVVVPAPAHRYISDGRDILLQGFHWHSHRGVSAADGSRRSWYRVIRENAERIKAAGFTWVWMPPPSDSLAPEGYIPRRWHRFDASYGTETELRSAIQALQPVKAMADVVINHRVGVATAGADFEDPPFPDNRTAIVGNDQSGVGGGQPDTGDLNPAGRDLDHTNPQVRAAIMDYLHRLRSLGFHGWRYDLCKGYHPRFVGEYNDATNPELSVGEYYDGDRQKVTNWIDGTGGRTTAFDFPARYALYETCTSDDFTRLRSQNGSRTVPAGLIGFWPAHAVTFVDNHDTEYRRDHEHECHYDGTRHFPAKTVAMGHAYLLTHPGIPCVFWSHFFDWDAETRGKIERLIWLRRALGIHARSAVDIREARPGLYAALIDGKLAVKLGSRGWCPGGDWRLALDGERFAIWTRPGSGTASKASCLPSLLQTLYRYITQA